MNLIEAIKSGKRFKRPHWDIYYSNQMEEELQLSIEELLAEDWEVEEKQVTITLSQFTRAWNRALTSGNEPLVYDSIVKELGL